ncbi:hypothetical protein V1514DRAFT_171222 [Lipomyces japonicus]|uniref:uncharacterized protein n=1 Tax=Lipomyces japonicus TaxID=56871 RepID=UPI0034CFA1A1
METSRGESPIRDESPLRTESVLYDHRNQPDSLPVRGSISDGIHRRSGSNTSDVRPQLYRTNSNGSTAIEYDAEDEDDGRAGSLEIPSGHHRSHRLSSSHVRGTNIVINIPESSHASGRGDGGVHAALSPSSASRLASPRNGSSIPQQSRRARRNSINERNIKLTDRRPTIDSITSKPNIPPSPAILPKEPGHKADDLSSTSDSDSDVNSRVNSDAETEEDVCFPMHLEHQRINGIDFDELEEFAAAQRLEQWYPGLSRSADNDLGPYSRRLTFSSVKYVPQKADVADDNKTPVIKATTNNTPSSAESEKTAAPSEDEIELLKSKMLPPEAATRLATMSDRFSLFCSESEETIHAPEICLLTADGQSFADLFDKANGTWWLDCLDPTDDEMKMLSKSFGIHPLTTEDIRVQETREKVELFRSYYFVCFRTFEHEKDNEEFLEPLNFYMVVFRDGILSFHYSPLNHTANVRRRIRQLRDYVAVSADWICYALIDDITDGFAPVIHEIEKEADGIEDSVFVARESDFGDMLRRIGEARKTVMTLMRLLSGKADVIKMFAKRCNEQWDVAPKGEIGLYLGDIQDHIVTMYQNLSAYEKILSRSHANYLAQLQVESFYSNNRVTQMFSKITLIGTILVPLNLITGLFGMNVTIPGENQGNLKWFFGILGVIVFIVIVSFIIARKWLENNEREEGRHDKRSDKRSD